MTEQNYVSFDLYDTVIMRQFSAEISVLELCWEELRSHKVPVPDLQSYIDFRSAANSASSHIDAPKLSQILEYLPDSLIPHRHMIETIETNIELQQLIVVPGILELISHLRSCDKNVAFISDMHIGSEYLGPKLVSLGVMNESDRILVSSDIGLSKARNGKLFEHFLQSNKISANSMTHFGNDPWSDIKMAKRVGLSTVFIPRANFNHFEKLMQPKSIDKKHGEVLVHASRTTRLKLSASLSNTIEPTDDHMDSLTGIACGVAAPVLYCFVLWAIKKCRQESITTIRFLTRDGELLKAIADELCSELTENMDIQLLEVSRKSLVLPSASVVPYEDWVHSGFQPGQFLCQHYDRLSAEQLVQRAGLTFEQDHEILAHYGLKDPHSSFDDASLNSWKQALLSPEVQRRVRSASEDKRRSLESYLDQNFSGQAMDKVALIDVGWTGQQASILSALLVNQFGCDPHHLLIGRLRKAQLMRKTNISGWLFDETQNRPSPVVNPVALFESFLATMTGGVVGYETSSNQQVTAIRRAQEHEPELASWGLETVQQCVIEYAKVASHGYRVSDENNDISLCRSLLTQFWNSPNRQEARCWGAFPYEQDQVGLSIQTLAKPYTLPGLITRLWGKKNNVDWKAGSVKLTPAPLRQLLTLHGRIHSN